MQAKPDFLTKLYNKNANLLDNNIQHIKLIKHDELKQTCTDSIRAFPDRY